MVGTSGADVTTAGTAAGKSLNVNSYAGIDSLTVSNAVKGGNIGMGGDVDSVTLSEEAKELNITLGDGADTFTDTASKPLSKVTVGGQGGADTFTLLGAAANSYFGGGKGKDIFRGSTTDGGTVGAATTIVGGSEVDTIGVSTDGIIFGAKSFINGQVGADKIYVRANAAGTVRGGSEADVITVTHGTTALELYGDKGADLITAGNAANTILGGGGSDSINGGTGTDSVLGGQGKDSITGGGGADTIDGGAQNDTIVGAGAADSILGGDGADSLTGAAGNDSILGGSGDDTIDAGAGTDSLTGGSGADRFVVSSIFASNAAVQKTVSDFSVAGSDKIGNFSITNLETSADTTDLISAGDATTIATTTTIAVTKVSGNYDLGTAGTGNILTLSSATAFTNTSVADALESGGSLQLTANGAIADGDGFIIIYDDNVDTYIALAESAASVSDNAVFGTSGLLVDNMIKLSGVADATSITASNLLTFVA